MKVMKYIIVGLLCFITLGCGGSDDKTEPLPPPPEAKYVFAVTFDNYAWVEQHRGFFLTADGELFLYEHELSINEYTGIFLNNTYTEIEISKNFGDEPTLLEQIDEEELTLLRNKIPAAQQGELSEDEQRCNDAGRLAFFTFTFDPNTESYTPVLLEKYGTLAQINYSTEAKQLKVWLLEKAQSYGYFQNVNNCSFVESND
jgi:hypothetical protein